MSDCGIATYRDRTGAQARVRYSRQGHGTAVLLIHGVGMQASVWRPQIDALAGSHDVIALDMPGHGGSSLPPEDVRLSDYADQAVALLDALDVARAHVIGHSMGALVALEVALSHPGRVVSVIALSPVFCRTSAQRAAIEARVGALKDTAEAPSWDATIARWFGAPVPEPHRAAAGHIVDLLNAIDPVGYERTYRLFAKSDTAHRDRLAGLQVPALFVTGERDPNSSPAMTHAMAALAPGSRAEIVAAERHMLTLTASSEINRRVLGFLRQVEGRASPPRRDNAAVEPVARPPGFDARNFRKALGSFLTGVTVVATLQEDGEPRGFTANSFTSVSLDPPLVLVCIAKSAASCPVFSGAAHFSVNILAESQASVSSLFATKSADKFAKASWKKGPAGSPILAGVTAWFDCRRHNLVEAGDHVVLLGEVVGFDHTAANPLGYCRGAHVTFGLSLDAVAASGGRTRVGAILEHEGAIALVADDQGGFDLPYGTAAGVPTDAAGLAGVMHRLGLKADLGFLFAVFEDPARGPGAMSVVYRGALQERPTLAGRLHLAGFDQIPWDRIKDGATRSMLRRYIQERREDVFGVYVGDAERGTVQPLARSA